MKKIVSCIGLGVVALALVLTLLVVAFPAEAATMWQNITWLSSKKVVVYNSSSAPDPATLAEGDLTIAPDGTGGNALAKNELSGRLRVKGVSLGTMTNGAATAHTLTLMDETPTGEWTASTGEVTRAADAATYRMGTASLKTTWTTSAEAADGITMTIASLDWTDNESIGGYFNCNKKLAAGDLKFGIRDSVAGKTLVNVPAVTVPNRWVWLEIDISGVAAASKDHVDNIYFELSSAGVLKEQFICYLDYLWKWDASDEEALGTAILQDGVLTIQTVVDANTATHESAFITEGTDFFVHYETGNDFVVTVTDQSTKSGVALVVY